MSRHRPTLDGNSYGLRSVFCRGSSGKGDKTRQEGHHCLEGEGRWKEKEKSDPALTEANKSDVMRCSALLSK